MNVFHQLLEKGLFVDDLFAEGLFVEGIVVL